VWYHSVEHHVTLLDPRILTSLLRFWKICLPLNMPVSNFGTVICWSDWGPSFSSVPPGRSTTAPLHLIVQEGTNLNSTSFLGRGTDRFQWPLTCWDRRSNPAGGMDVCLLCILCVVRPLRLADPSPRGVQPSVYVSLCAIRHNNDPLHQQWVDRQRSD